MTKATKACVYLLDVNASRVNTAFVTKKKDLIGVAKQIASGWGGKVTGFRVTKGVVTNTFEVEKCNRVPKSFRKDFRLYPIRSITLWPIKAIAIGNRIN